jgi:serine protease AprX
MAKNQSLQCPLCQDQVEKLVYRFHVENEQEVIDRIKADHREWVEEDGVCTRCLDYYQIEGIRAKRILPEVGPYFSVKSVDDFIILPTALRLDADPHFTGKGITICLIDSGFYLHDDLIKTKNRVKAVIDITEPSRTTDYFLTPHPESWHGTMTSVVCAGDGFASNGLYKSIASEAELVLIKTQTTDEKDPYNGRITNQSIAAAMRWVLAHHKEYNIKIVSISVGADLTESRSENEINELAEELIKNGIVVVAAIGNDVNGQLKPPASALNVIAIGGLDDGNQLHASGLGLYHSAFGFTSEGYVKPELIANAIWIAAPILPGTPEKKEAEHLHALLGLTDYDLAKNVNQNAKKISKETGLSIGSKIEEANSFRQQIVSRIQQTKFFSADYMHVDGTSFAAPIVSHHCTTLAEQSAAYAC